MSDEIIDGEDQLGVLLMGHDFKSWWCGSLLSIHDARKHRAAPAGHHAAGGDLGRRGGDLDDRPSEKRRSACPTTSITKRF